LGIADEIVGEPLGGAHNDPAPVIAATGQRITAALDELANLSGDELVSKRYLRLRAIGVWSEPGQEPGGNADAADTEVENG